MKALTCTAWNFLACLLSMTLIGCVPAALVVGAGAGAGTYAYIEGVSKAVYPVPFETMWAETQTMLAAEDVGVTAKTKESGQGTIQGRNADGKDVAVDLAVQGAKSTAVDIRVGLIPDEPAAERLQRALARRVNVTLPFGSS